ncbi:MAG: type VI secretion system-associated FHA domain protein TagH [Candidatus Thiodiazotropha sp.]
MKITLTVTQAAGQPPAQPMSVSFDEDGGRIGRRADNEWVLPDPERFISGHHAQIIFTGGRFQLLDTSSNGVFLNGASTPLGKNNQVDLKDGDNITIGDYEIRVSLPISPQNAVIEQSFESLDDPFAALSAQHAGGTLEEVFPNSEEAPAVDAPLEEKSYQLEESEPREFTLSEPEESSPKIPPASDHTSDLNAYFNQPTPIPEDWDIDEPASASTPEAQAAPEILPPLEKPETPAPPPPPVWEELPPSPPPIPKPGPSAKPAPAASAPPKSRPAQAKPTQSGDESALRQALADGLEIPASHLESQPLTALLQTLGQILRISTEGHMSLLRVRAQIKGEFRMNQTMIKPVENNPLKFSINTDEALQQLLNPNPGSGYLPALAAFEEAHEDIEAHMMAVMVGMQAALKVVLQRFKPEILEQRLGQSALLEKLPMYRRAKTWDLFTALYQEIATEAEDDFHQLFGRTFSQAYEDQIRRLEALKNADPGGL